MIETIPVPKLHAFAGHPYKVLDNDEMERLTESIQNNGILTPLLVRPLEGTTDEYEVISGHRRLHAAQKAGITEVPALICPIDRDAAAILLVDSNLHREHILPSEKAFAYALKMKAMKQQGKRTDLTSSQVATKYDAATEIGAAYNESRDKVFRYIRLTHLVPELLDLMDEGRIAFSVGVELSYLDQESQECLADLIDRDDRTPSYSQAVRMHKEYVTDTDGIGLPWYRIAEIMSEDKPNQREQIKLRRDDLNKYFPSSYTDDQIKRDILKGLDLLKRQRSRDAR